MHTLTNCQPREQVSAFVTDKWRTVRPASSEYSMHNVSACPRSLSTHAACPDTVPLGPRRACHSGGLAGNRGWRRRTRLATPVVRPHTGTCIRRLRRKGPGEDPAGTACQLSCICRACGRRESVAHPLTVSCGSSAPVMPRLLCRQGKHGTRIEIPRAGRTGACQQPCKHVRSW